MNVEFEEKRPKGKFWIKILIVGASLIVIFVLLRVLGIFQWYSVDGSSNMPALQSNQSIIATNLTTPKRFDLITYIRRDRGIDEVWINRICAFEGETVSFEAGTFFIDGKNMDEGLNLQYRYRCEDSYGEIIARELFLIPNVDYYPNPYDYSNDSIDLFLTDEQVNGRSLLKRVILNESNELIADYWGETWNENYFGPITVPKNHCFVLGDNRDMSFDSRFFGFIHVDDIYGVLF